MGTQSTWGELLSSFAQVVGFICFERTFLKFRIKRWEKEKEKEKDKDLAMTIIIVLSALCFVVLDAGHVQFTTGCVKTKMKVKQPNNCSQSGVHLRLLCNVLKSPCIITLIVQ